MAQNKRFTNYLSGYVFYNSKIITSATGMSNVYLGRPWGALVNKTRERYTVNLSSSHIAQYAPNAFLAGTDGWLPTNLR